jgi:hypothetical protein
MISVPSGGLVPQTNPNQSVMNMFGVQNTPSTSPPHLALARPRASTRKRTSSKAL